MQALKDIQLVYILAMTGDLGVSGNGDSWMAVSALCGVSDGSFALVVAFYELEDGKNQQGQATVFMGSSPAAALDLARLDASLDAFDWSGVDVDMCFDSGGRIIINTVTHYVRLCEIQFLPQMDLLAKLSTERSWYCRPLSESHDVCKYFRLAQDNNAYTYLDFLWWYGPDLGKRRWEVVWPASKQARKLAAVLAL